MWTQCSNNGCGEIFEVENNKFGQMIKCKKCGKDFRAMFSIAPADQKSDRSETGNIPLKRDEVKIPLPLSQKICPKCGHICQVLIPLTECPKCGIIYEKYTAKPETQGVNFRQTSDTSEIRTEETPKKQGSSFLRGLFNIPMKYIEKRDTLRRFRAVLQRCLSDGELTPQEMEQLKQFCIQEGLNLQDALAQSQGDIEWFLHGMLAQVVSDGIVTPEEEESLRNVCRFLNPSNKIQKEIGDTIASVKQICHIKSGDITPLSTHTLVSKIDELVWHHHPGVKFVRQMAKGPVTHHGELYITSERIIFKSHDAPTEITLGKIVEVEGKSSEIYIVGKTKNTTAHFQSPDGLLIEAYIDQALQKYHRKLNLKQTAKKSRSIPQEVKQAVWIRDKGQCAECGASEYLEFDHIIPYSKGGSNSEINIQLLCRKCNLAKLDRI